MDRMLRYTPRSYEDFQPSFEWNREEGSDTLVISLPGFKREQLKAQMDNFGNLKVSGERPLSGERWSRFRKDFRVPQNTGTADIHAKFENENLYVIFPRLFATSHPQIQPTKEQEPESAKKTTEPESAKKKTTEPESAKKTTTDPKPKEDQDRMMRKDTPVSSSTSDGNAMNQSNGKNRKMREPVDAMENVQKTQEEKKDQINRSEDKKATSEIGGKDAELANSRKAMVEDEKTADGGRGLEVPKPKAGELGMRFKKPRQLMLNVGVAIVILVGVILNMFYKLRKSIETESN